MSEKRQISSMFKLNNDEIEALKTKYINDKKNEGTDVDHKNSAISAINDQQHLKPEQKSESISLYHQYESTESIPQTHLLTYDSDNDKAKKPVHRVSRTVLIILGCIIVVSGIILTLILFSGKNNDSVSPESTVSEITSESRAESEKSEVSENSEISNSNEITDLKLNKTEFTIGKGEVANLTPVFEPADSENKTIESCYDQLVGDVQRILDGKTPVSGSAGVGDIVIPGKEKGFFDKYKWPIVAVVILLIAVGGFLAYSSMNNGSSNGSNKTGMSIGYIGLENYGGTYTYFVFGTIAEGFSNSSSDVVHIDYYDNAGKVVKSSNTKIGDVEGNILGSVDVNKKNIVKVSAQLQDKDKKVLYSVESENIIEQ